MYETEDLISPIRAEEFPHVVEVWEASVRATHDFLTEADIQYFKPIVLEKALPAVKLAAIRQRGGEGDGQVVGFVGVHDRKMEMLFIHPDWRGRGVGRRLLRHAVETMGAKTVDVNEQNEQAVGFYLRMGCEVVSRSELDSLGKPFPLLHMKLAAPATGQARAAG